MSERRVLFITEGERDDPRFLKKIHNLLLGTKPGNIYTHGHSIHSLVSKMLVDGVIDEDLDVVALLREEASEEKATILDQDFTDVYLIFDMDPQDSIYDGVNLEMVMDFFSDSTENGKLYLNYPMLESYRHLKEPYDRGYLTRTVALEDVSRYKEIVNEEAYDGIKDLGKFGEDTAMMILELNARKANLLLCGDDGVPSSEEYLVWNMFDLLKLQTEAKDTHGYVHVLNTCVFNILDFNPEKFLGSMTRPEHRS